MNNVPKELLELRANVENLTKKYKEVKAMPDSGEHDKMSELEDMMFRSISYIHDRISYVENSFYDYQWSHSKGHLPGIPGAEKMESALKVLGLGGDYEVWKPMITSASEKFGIVLEDK